MQNKNDICDGDSVSKELVYEKQRTFEFLKNGPIMNVNLDVNVMSESVITI